MMLYYNVRIKVDLFINYMNNPYKYINNFNNNNIN